MPGLKICKDCTAEGRGSKPRPAPYPGPRCATHHRAERKRRRRADHDRRQQTVYGLPEDGYLALLRHQGGVCACCGHRTGRRGVVKALATDHDHRTGEVRGLLCGPCNRIIGAVRDDPVTLLRMAMYLCGHTPAREMWGTDGVPLHRDVRRMVR